MLHVRFVGAAVLLLFVAGCATRPIYLRPQPRSFTERDYDDVYEAWTREADDFDFGSLEDVLNVTATFESWEFRWAYVVRYGSDHALDTEARTAMLRATLADAQVHHRFFVTMAGTNYRESDITSERAAWRILLVDEEGRQSVPIEVEKVTKAGAGERRYFESVSPFRHSFRVAFPAYHQDGTPTISPDAQFVMLRFTGPNGTVDLTWRFGV